MVEQEAVNFEVAGSSPAVGAKKIVRPYGLAFFFVQRLTGFSNRNAGAVQGCGSITRSRTGKFTYPNVTMLYLDSPAVGAKHKDYDLDHGIFVLRI